MPIVYAVSREHTPDAAPEAISRPNAAQQPAKEPRFIRIPNAITPCRCVKDVPTFQGKVRYETLKVAGASVPGLKALSGSLRQGRIIAVHPTSITVGHVTCTRNVPLDLSGFRVGSLAVISCSLGHLVGIEPASPGLYIGSVPIAPAGR
jgi:hypothetical protein